MEMIVMIHKPWGVELVLDDEDEEIFLVLEIIMELLPLGGGWYWYRRRSWMKRTE